MQESNAILNTLREYLGDIWLIDTHEHIVSESEWVSQPEGLCDFTYFFPHYASDDIASAGCSQDDWKKITDKDTPLDEKWRLFEPYWEKAKNTAYCKAINLAIRDLFGLPDLSRETYKELSARIFKTRKPGYYEEILKNRARIEKSILNTNDPQPDPKFFAPVIPTDSFISIDGKESLVRCEQRSGISIQSIDDLIKALEMVFKDWVAKGAIGTKCAVAYSRTLYFEDPSKAEADKSFDSTIKNGDASSAKPMQDYLMHQLLKMTFDAGLPMQIHTGIQAGNGNTLANSNPLHLTNILMKYYTGKFDLFHAGYPFTSELGVLTKMFPGVCADLCWMHIISPAAARQALSEWLELVPASKIFGFGGDYLFVEGAYAHAKMARENVARVLAEKVNEGYFSLAEAKNIAQMIMHDNAKEFFGI